MEATGDETLPAVLDEVRTIMERMNEAQAEVNAVSNNINELDLQRSKLLEECKEHLVTLSKKYGSRIDAARRFHAAREQEEKARAVMEHELQVYKDKLLVRDAAKETLYLLESRLKELQAEDAAGGIKRNLDWLDQINSKTQQVQTAQAELNQHWEAYQQAVKNFRDAEEAARSVEKRNSRSIRLTRDYFTTRDYYQRQVDALNRARREKMSELGRWREVYNKSLDALDRINRDVHADRTAKKLLGEGLQRRELLGADILSINSSVDLDPHFISSGLNTPTRMSEDEWTDSDSVGCFSLDDAQLRRRPGMIVNRTSTVAEHPLSNR